MTESVFLQAFKGNEERVPVWFMRQAGRYLPEYQAIRKYHSLDEMFSTPELAAEITCQPIDILRVDAAILFADILTLPSHMGFDIHFDPQKGPVIGNPVSGARDLSYIHDTDRIKHIEKTIALVKDRLPAYIPLIGFAGSPFTVLCYCIEGGSSDRFKSAFAYMSEQPEQFKQLMEIFTRNTINYLKMQRQAGADAFQLFDTWAGMLAPEDYHAFVLPYVQRIFAAVDLPSIYYVKNSLPVLGGMVQSGANFVSVDETVPLDNCPLLEQSGLGVQGNLSNRALYEDYPVLEQKVDKILLDASRFKKYIFNLNHGVLPDMNVEKLKFVTRKVQSFKRKLVKV